MELSKAFHIIHEFYQRYNRFVFSQRDLLTLLREEKKGTAIKTIRSLVKHKFLSRVCKDAYVLTTIPWSTPNVLWHVAQSLRRRYVNYFSLEFMASRYSFISQIMPDRITVMTTGPSQTFYTTLGVIEFTHTEKSLYEIMDTTKKREDEPLRYADMEATLRDLQKVNRNRNMIDWEEVVEEFEDILGDEEEARKIALKYAPKTFFRENLLNPEVLGEEYMKRIAKNGSIFDHFRREREKKERLKQEKDS